MCLCVCACLHVCVRVCVCVCVLSFVGSQLNLANLPRLSAVFSLSLSSPLLFLSLSDEQIELLNELFLWAPNAHPQLSICSFPPSVRLSLPPLTHPSIPPPPPHTPTPPTTLLSPWLSCCNNVYICRHWRTRTHIRSPSSTQCRNVGANNLSTVDKYMFSIKGAVAQEVEQVAWARHCGYVHITQWFYNDTTAHKLWFKHVRSRDMLFQAC